MWSSNNSNQNIVQQFYDGFIVAFNILASNIEKVIFVHVHYMFKPM